MGAKAYVSRKRLWGGKCSFYFECVLGSRCIGGKCILPTDVVCE